VKGSKRHYARLEEDFLQEEVYAVERANLSGNLNHSAESAQKDAVKSKRILRTLAGQHGQPSNVNRISPKE
jgi:hypothetical protein